MINAWSDALAQLEDWIDQKVEEMSPFRATVSSLNAGLVLFQRQASDAVEDQEFARIEGFDLAVNDEVIVLPLGNEDYIVINKIQRSTPNPIILTPNLKFLGHLHSGGTAPTATVLTAAGTTGAASIIEGNDISGLIQVIPGGTGIASGSIVTLNFAVAYPTSTYSVQITVGSSASRSLTPGNVGATSRTTSGFTIATPTALTSGSTYQWYYTVVYTG